MDIARHQELYDYFGKKNPQSSRTKSDMKLLRSFIIGKNESLPEDLLKKGITTGGYAFRLYEVSLYGNTNLDLHFGLSPTEILEGLRFYDESFKERGRQVERGDDGILRIYPLKPISDAWGYCCGKFEDFISGPEGLLDYYFWMLENTSKFSFELITAFTQNDGGIGDRVITFETYKDAYSFRDIWFGNMDRDVSIEDIDKAILLAKSIEDYLKIPSKERRKKIREHPMYPQNIRSLLQ